MQIAHAYIIERKKIFDLVCVQVNWFVISPGQFTGEILGLNQSPIHYKDQSVRAALRRYTRATDTRNKANSRPGTGNS